MSVREGRPVENFRDWSQRIEKDLAHEQRRPKPPTAKGLLGPGFGPRAVELLDWNSETARFNGFWFSEDALNQPGPGTFIGMTVAGLEHGAQFAADHAADGTLWTRRVHMHSLGAPAFGAWTLATVPTGAVMFLAVGSPLPAGYVESAAAAPTGLRAIQRA